MLDRVRAIEAELESLMGGVRANIERLGEELGELSRGLGDLSAASFNWTAGEGPGDVRAPEARTDEGLDQEENARLIALDMALDGIPREETDRHLAEHFRLRDREGLLEEIYAEVGQPNA